MPTPAKLVCAILFAALAWYSADTLVREALPEGVVVGKFREWIALAGLIIGWKVIGKTCTGPTNKGTRISVAITSGIGGAVILVLLGLFFHSAYATLNESLTSKYTEVGLAAEAWMEVMWKDAKIVSNPVALVTLFGGAAVVGLIGGIVGRTLR